MNHAFADRDFYYGDPYFPPEEPIEGLLSKDYAKSRVKEINLKNNNPNVKPGDPYQFMAGSNPFKKYLDNWGQADLEENVETSDHYRLNRNRTFTLQPRYDSDERIKAVTK